LTSFQKQKVRGVVGAVRGLWGMHHALEDDRTAEQQRQRKRRETLGIAQRELDDLVKSSRGFSRERRAELEQQAHERVASCEGEVAGGESRLAELSTQLKAIEDDLRPAGEFARALVAAIDDEDGDFRAEVGGRGPREIGTPDLRIRR
jgi:hypothetical protein